MIKNRLSFQVAAFKSCEGGMVRKGEERKGSNVVYGLFIQFHFPHSLSVLSGNCKCFLLSASQTVLAPAH